MSSDLSGQVLCRVAGQPNGFFRSAMTGLVLLTGGLLLGPSPAAAQTRCVVLELYTRGEDAKATDAEAVLQKFAESRQAVRVQRYDLDQEGPHVARFEQIRKYFRIEQEKVPAVFVCNYLLSNWADNKTLVSQVTSALNMTVFVRSGCSKCAAAKEFLRRYGPRYPCLKIQLRDVVDDPKALDRFNQLAARYGTPAASLPGFHVCNQMTVGFISEQISGRKILALLDRWTVDCQPEGTSLNSPTVPAQPSVSVAENRSFLIPNSRLDWELMGFRAMTASAVSGSRGPVSRGGLMLALPSLSVLTVVAQQQPDADLPPLPDSPLPGGPPTEDPDGENSVPPPPGTDNLPPLFPPSGGAGAAPPPMPLDESNADESLPPPGDPPVPTGSSGSGVIEVPFLGELKLSRLGMPAFTFLVGLVDGFNPCAMWVLLFLLSLLVNLKDRMRILAVAGSFVLISGLAYFTFMAFTLSVVRLVRYLRAVQITLGVLAVFVGSIHVKDFFAFKKGLSLSIPESAKPGIYARTRKIIMAENLIGAVTGACVLAVLVNVIELLCTAGLPALYIGILRSQGLEAWQEYAYIGLYNVAYMLDDSLMVVVVVWTLEKRKLQESGGRILKLVSGAFILVLGLVMIFCPQLLEM